MPSETFEQQLDRAAAVCGIDPGYWDIWGRYHPTTQAAKQSILGSMGMAAGSAEELELSLHELARRQWERPLPPAVVARESPEIDLPLNVASESLGERAHVAVRQEDGTAHEFELNLWELPQTGSAEMDGRTWVRKHVRLPLELPLGYHEIAVTIGRTSAVSRYIVTPERA